ncbi:hypothetical protein MKX01_014934 [Papaver californicum]|nr:hypothetical protein MKX01_014934 [Papaver californicum]
MEPSTVQEGVIVLDDKKDQLRVKRKTLQAVLEQCQRALDLINSGEVDDGDGEDDDESEVEVGEDSLNQFGDDDTVQLCNFLKSGVDSPNFLEKLGTTSASAPHNLAEEGGSWDIVCENDLWDGEDIELDQESYVLVRQEDILEGIASFTAAYLLSLKQTKELTPNQLQEALSKTFCTKKKKGKLRKAWDGSKVIYNVASWGATAIGIYQNPALFRVATVAFWTSCRVISKLF